MNVNFTFSYTLETPTQFRHSIRTVQNGANWSPYRERFIHPLTSTPPNHTKPTLHFHDRFTFANHSSQADGVDDIRALLLMRSCNNNVYNRIVEQKLLAICVVAQCRSNVRDVCFTGVHRS